MKGKNLGTDVKNPEKCVKFEEKKLLI